MKHFHKLILLLSILSINMFTIAQQAKYIEDQYTINKKYYELLEKGKEPSKTDEDKYLKGVPKDISKELLEIKNIDRKSYFKLLKEAWNINNYFTYAADDYPFKLSSSELKSKLIQQEFHKNVQVKILTFRYNAAKENDKMNLRKNLNEKLNEIFELKGTMKSEEIKYLESKLNELKKSLKERKKDQNRIVEKKLKEILKEKIDDKLKWN